MTMRTPLKMFSNSGGRPLGGKIVDEARRERVGIDARGDAVRSGRVDARVDEPVGIDRRDSIGMRMPASGACRAFKVCSWDSSV